MEYNTELLKEMIPWLVPVVVALIAIGLVMRLIGRVRNRMTRLRPQDARAIGHLANALLGLLVAVIMLTLLEVLEVPLGNVWTAVSTVLALVAIGFFAVWSVLSHLTAALVLFFQRPFRIGDTLQLADDDYRGDVVKKGMFFTTVRDADGGHSHIPNNLLFQRRFRVGPAKSAD
jgi:small-conductance mechanosensitive channel